MNIQEDRPLVGISDGFLQQMSQWLELSQPNR